MTTRTATQYRFEPRDEVALRTAPFIDHTLYADLKASRVVPIITIRSPLEAVSRGRSRTRKHHVGDAHEACELVLKREREAKERERQHREAIHARNKRAANRLTKFAGPVLDGEAVMPAADDGRRPWSLISQKSTAQQRLQAELEDARGHYERCKKYLDGAKIQAIADEARTRYKAALLLVPADEQSTFSRAHEEAERAKAQLDKALLVLDRVRDGYSLYAAKERYMKAHTKVVMLKRAS